jgi:hypothetical protein
MAYNIWVALAERDRIRSGREGIWTVPSALLTEMGKLSVVVAAALTAGLVEAAAELAPSKEMANTMPATTPTVLVRLCFPALVCRQCPCLMANFLSCRSRLGWGQGFSPATSSLPRRALSPPTDQATWLAPSPELAGGTTVAGQRRVHTGLRWPVGCIFDFRRACAGEQGGLCRRAKSPGPTCTEPRADVQGGLCRRAGGLCRRAGGLCRRAGGLIAKGASPAGLCPVAAPQGPQRDSGRSVAGQLPAGHRPSPAVRWSRGTHRRVPGCPVPGRWTATPRFRPPPPPPPRPLCPPPPAILPRCPASV